MLISALRRRMDGQAAQQRKGRCEHELPNVIGGVWFLSNFTSPLSAHLELDFFDFREEQNSLLA